MRLIGPLQIERDPLISSQPPRRGYSGLPRPRGRCGNCFLCASAEISRPSQQIWPFGKPVHRRQGVPSRLEVLQHPFFPVQDILTTDDSTWRALNILTADIATWQPATGNRKERSLPRKKNNPVSSEIPAVMATTSNSKTGSWPVCLICHSSLYWFL